MMSPAVGSAGGSVVSARRVELAAVLFISIVALTYSFYPSYHRHRTTPDGRVYVGQPQDGYVRIHGPDAELLGRFGHEGDHAVETTRQIAAELRTAFRNFKNSLL